VICPICQQETQVNEGKFVWHGECAGGWAYTDLAATKLESRYTEPTDECPYPERWHADDWDSAELEVTRLVAGFVAALRPDWVLETGTAFGQTAEAIGKVLRQARVGRLVTIEIDPTRAKDAHERLKDLPVVVVNQSSLEVELETGPRYGFCWFDSLLPLRVPEFRRFYPMMTPGCIVGFHDTKDSTLWEQIEELEAEGLLLPIRLHTPRGVVFGEVVGR
jgi:hypothetical protein